MPSTARADWPLAPQDTAWDATAAVTRLRQWASSDGTGDPGTLDFAKYGSVHFDVATAESTDPADYLLPFCDVTGDATDPAAIFAGVEGCAGAVDGGTAGIPDGDTDDVKAAIGGYYTRAADEYDDDTIAPPWSDDSGAPPAAPAPQMSSMQLAANTPDGKPGNGIGFRIPVMALENQWTDDGRIFEQFTWREPPLPLMYQPQDVHAESLTAPPTFHVGIIHTIGREGSTIYGEGVFLDGVPQAAELESLLRQQGKASVSVDAGGNEFYVTFPEGEDEELEAFFFGETNELHIESPTIRYPTAQIMGCTAVAFPAFAGAYMELLDAPYQGAQPEPAAIAASIAVRQVDEPCLPCEQRRDGLALTAAGGPDMPPRAWFEQPEPPADSPLWVKTQGKRGVPLTITEDGLIFGHLALWGTCHTGVAGTCLTAPRSSMGYSMFHLGAVRTAEGEDLPVGHVTLGCGHADERLGMFPAAEHYDNTGHVVADVRASDGTAGVWISGALRPGVTDAQLRELRSAPLSGDWRWHGGGLELMAALCVNVPGFPVPRAHVASGQPLALVAAGAVPPRRPAKRNGHEVRMTVDPGPIVAAVREEVGRIVGPLLPLAREQVRARRQRQRTPR